MKKLIGLSIMLAFAANTLVAWSYFSGGYDGDTYGGNWQFPYSYDDESEEGFQPSGKVMPQQPKRDPVEQPMQEERRQPKSYEQQHPKLVIMFTKDECGYCRYMKPIMQQVEMKYGQDIKFIYVDVVQNPQAASQYGFQTVPQIMYFKDGQRLETHGSGDKTITAEQVEEKIKAHFGSEQSGS